MATVNWDDQKFCIDRFEFPNKVGSYPDYALSAYEAESLCKKEGKRLCSAKEWENACLGDTRLEYGYAATRSVNNCNDHKTGYIKPNWGLMYSNRWKTYAHTLYKADPSGSHLLCHSTEINGQNVFDMVGNVREWVSIDHGKYSYAVMGSYWFGTMQGPLGCHTMITNHAPNFASYEFGVRCCKSYDR